MLTRSEAEHEAVRLVCPEPTWASWHGILGEVERLDPGEVWVCGGRRGGKSRAFGAVAAAAALTSSYRPAPGERPTVSILARDLRQAAILHSYALAAVEELSGEDAVERPVAATMIRLRSGVRIETLPAHPAAVRGRTLLAAMCDEIALWPTDDAAAPDLEVLAAVRPSLITTGGRLWCASTPWRRTGAMWAARERWHGRPDRDGLYVERTSRELNPSLSQAWIDTQIRLDPGRAPSEYLVEWRDEVGGYLPVGAVDAAVSAWEAWEADEAAQAEERRVRAAQAHRALALRQRGGGGHLEVGADPAWSDVLGSGAARTADPAAI